MTTGSKTTGNAAVTLAGLALAGMVALVACLLSLDGEVEDGSALLAEHYVVDAWPFDLRITSAATLPLGERVLRLQRDGTEPEVLSHAGEASGSPAVDEPGAVGGTVVWTDLPVGPSEEPPREAALVWFPAASAATSLHAAFGDLPTTAPEELKGEGGAVVVRSERVPWGMLETPLVHERRYGPGRVFHDSVRVNVSTETGACILYVTWDAGLPGSVDRALEILDCIRPK